MSQSASMGVGRNERSTFPGIPEPYIDATRTPAPQQHAHIATKTSRSSRTATMMRPYNVHHGTNKNSPTVMPITTACRNAAMNAYLAKTRDILGPISFISSLLMLSKSRGPVLTFDRNLSRRGDALLLMVSHL